NEHKLQPFGDEGAHAIALPLERQRPDVLYERIGQAGDFLHPAGRTPFLRAHWVTQRDKRDVDSRRPADFPRVTSFPASTHPPMPAKASRISVCMAKEEARME